uniref:Putative reverse transcriptase domain-containing protein n=1 Tax=Tanacetum cinerariifolium TaxID=118510 RepID=A0A699I7B8_TANCI|nr:putative reverse transcriptase domain-containing protein [Tanacetum cinerariifolium]
MVDKHHKEVQKAFTSMGAEYLIYDATRDENENENDIATYHDFTACDVPKFDGALDPIASTRCLAAVKGAFRTSNCKEKNKVNFASNFLRDSAKMWWEGKVSEKGEEWIGACTWKEFKELFNAEFTPAKEIDRIREEFQTLMQTNESVNEMWKKFNDLIRYCPEYHGNEKLKVERFQRMLRDDIREVISPFKCTTLDDLQSRARVREADLLRKKNKEAKETKRKLSLEIVMPKSLNMIREERVEELKLRHHAIEAKPLKSIKEEKVEKAGIPNPTARVYMMATEEDKVVCDVVTGIKVDPAKIEAVMNWQTPKDIGEIRKKKDPNMRQQRWLGLLKDYDCEIRYHPDKTNVVANALSRKEREKVTWVYSLQMIVTSDLFDRIKAAQEEALKEENWKSERIASYIPYLEDDSRGVKTCQGRIYILFRSNVKELLLEEALKSKYSIHPGTTKMYLDLKRNYWWPGMKRDCAKYVEKCLTCLKVKAEHQNSYGKIQPLEIAVWKWEKITMDFVTKLPRTTKKHDSIWVIVDRLTKSAHLNPIRENMPVQKLAKIHVNEIVARHGVPVSIISNRDGRFTSNFWRDFQEELGTRLHISTTFHPQTGGSRESASTDVVLSTTEKIKTIRERLKEAQDRWKSYANERYNRPSQYSIIGIAFPSLLFQPMF